MSWTDFKAWLKETMGLDPATVGPTTVERAVRTRMAACALQDVAGYWNFVRTSAIEQQELIEAVVVPETSFFRDRDAFAALARSFDCQWLAAQPVDSQLRLLSLPCSSGEEPYSMVMALLDAGFPATRLHVDAVDISERALAKARSGLYGSNSFRGRDLLFRERHFEPVDDKWQLSEAVRKLVRFERGNVLATDLMRGEALYDAIFCRNLLIYFDEDTQVRTVGVLSRLLRAEGLLFVGPAETGLLLNLGFVSAQMPMAFAFRKPQARQADTPATMPYAQPTARPATVRPMRAAPTVPRRATHQPAAARPRSNIESSLEAAQKLADAGRFADALAVCEAHLEAHGPSAQPLYLLGLIHGATGQHARAEDHFRKALYLQPDHQEALVHLASLLETKGDMAGSRRLRLRARRHGEAAG
ncbi:MAG TPA: CheR family methyltransferase [Lysobacter sp.]